MADGDEGTGICFSWHQPLLAIGTFRNIAECSSAVPWQQTRNKLINSLPLKHGLIKTTLINLEVWPVKNQTVVTTAWLYP